MLEKLSFEIKETPVLYSANGETITSKTHKAIIKESGECISVMKNSYNPMYNKDFMESVDRMTDISEFELYGYSELNEGQIILAHLKNTKEDISIGGHKIEDYLVMGSSFNGSYPFFIGTSTVLIRCKNQFSKISRVEKVRHTKSSPKRREELMNGLEIYFSERRKMYETFENLRKISIDPQIIQMAQDYVLDISKQDRIDNKISTRKLNQIELLNFDMITEIEELGSNMWAVLNGVTKYTTHTIKQKESSFGNLFGTPSLINKKAFEFTTSMI